jgi:hypothetical protein
MGDVNQSAPRGTLREFFEDNKEATAPVWRYIPGRYKEKLEAMRRAGMYGGRGPDYANYVWAQEKGNAKALIAGRHFIENGTNRWRARRGQIIDDWYRNAQRA